MANFGEADGDARKKLFEGWLKPTQSMADEARSDTTASAGMAKEVFEGSRDLAYAGLGVLSGGADPKDIDAWQTWWNKNKNRRWDLEKP
jgi:hypothetical protein